ncbi:hypothetical protein TNCV_1267881 [Trichonephila clavipes]|nr:hypothetical protein TNCV_1267881 [Trichonephila clavipes]
MLGILDCATAARTLVNRRQIVAFKIGFPLTLPCTQGFSTLRTFKETLGRKLERDEDQNSSFINHRKNLTSLTSSNYNELNEQVTLSEWTKTAQMKKSSTNWQTMKGQAKLSMD